MIDTKPILFDLGQEYKSLYFLCKEREMFQDARLLLDKLFILEQLNSGDKPDEQTAKTI